MSDGTKIEWTDATWNPIVGCSLVSPGCTNCYAMRMAARIERMGTAPHYAGTTKLVNGHPVWTGAVNRAPDSILTAPLRWRRPRRIFVNSMSDLFHESVPDKWIDRIFAVMALAPQHTFQMLTKRPERMREYVSKELGVRIQDVVDNMEPDGIWKFPGYEPWIADDFPLPNVGIGVSVEDQRRADERVPILLDTPAAVRWISAEPMLGPIDPTRICIVPKVAGSPRAGIHIDALRGRYVESRMPYIGSWDADGPYPAGALPRRLDWVVAGGESGPGARPANPQWFRDLRDQCAAAGVPYLHKQNGEWVSVSEVAGDGPHHRFADGRTVRRIGKKAAGRLLDGVIHDAYPEAFR